MEKSIAIKEDQIIHWKVSGKLEQQTTEDVLREIARINSNRKYKMPMLVDIVEMTNISMSARKYGINWLDEGHTPKIAVYGASGFVSFIVQKIIAVSSMKGSFKLFEKESEAREWLKH